MSLLDLLRGLHGSSHLTLSREEGKLRVFPRAPEPLRPLLVSYKTALLHALEERERVQALRFLEDPYRLVCLAVHTFPLEAPVVLTLAYGDAFPSGKHLDAFPSGKHLEDVRRYLAPVGNLSGYLLWAGRNLPPPHRMHFSPTTGKWALEWRKGWEVVIEAQVRGKRYLLFYPEKDAHSWESSVEDGEVRLLRLHEQSPVVGM